MILDDRDRAAGAEGPSDDLAALRLDRTEPGPASRRRPVAGLAVLAVVVAGGVVVAMVWPRADEADVPAATATGSRSPTGPTGSTGPAPVPGGLTANGYVVARSRAALGAVQGGRVATILVREGDEVAAGDVVARLESREQEAAVLQAEADAHEARAALTAAEVDVAEADRELERMRGLADVVAAKVLDDAETDHLRALARHDAAVARVRSAEARLAVARANLDATVIRAPFAGTILRRDSEVGEVLVPGGLGGVPAQAVAVIADLGTLEVEVDVNEAHIARVQPGQPAEVTLDAYPSDRFPARVRQVMPTADRQRATVTVRVAIEARDPRILPEMGARVAFHID